MVTNTFKDALIIRIELDLTSNQKKIWNDLSKISHFKHINDLDLTALTKLSLEKNAEIISNTFIQQVENQITLINLYLNLSELPSNKDISYNSKLTELYEQALMFYTKIEEYEFCVFIKEAIDELGSLKYNSV